MYWPQNDASPDVAAAAWLVGSWSSTPKTELPPGARLVRYASRAAGGGSLGRPRYVAIVEWNGGRLFREWSALPKERPSG